MGEFLTSPKEEKKKEDNSDGFLRYGVCSMQGWKKRMENTYISEINKDGKNKNFDIFAIFEGHGGSEVSEFVKKHFCEELYKNKNFNSNSMKTALTETFLKMDVLMRKEEGKKELKELREKNTKEENEQISELIEPNKDLEVLKKMMSGAKEEEEENVADLCGCTACVGVVDKINKKMIFAFIGNTQVFFGHQDSQSTLLDIHHDLKGELQRIKEAGGWITDNLLKGNLNVSRSLGDFEYKKKSDLKKNIILAEPEIWEYNFKSDDDYLIFVSEGILDFVQKDDICGIINQYVKDNNKNLNNDKLSDILDYLFGKILANDIYNNLGKAYNNMTSILIRVIK